MTILLLFSMLTVDSVLNQPELTSVQYGLCVVDLEGDRVVYARNARKLLIPASNMKIITTAATLKFLDHDFRFKTLLAIKGTIRKKELHGDVIIIGGGDPTLSLEGISQFVTAVSDKRIKTITGNIIVIDNLFQDIALNKNTFRYERLPVGWAWHYLDARYAPEISALSVNKNVVNVKMKATQLGEFADVSIEPATEYVTLLSDMITKAGEDSIIVYRLWDRNTIYVSGGVGRGRERNIEVAVKDPALFAGHYLSEQLREAGIKVRGDVVRVSSHTQMTDILEGCTRIDSVLSVPLIEILPEVTIESDNLYAEMLLKTLGVQHYNEGSFVAGIRMLKRFLYVCSVDTSAVSLWDGSGLSRHNLISPYALVLALRYMYRSDDFETFYELLPRSGEGTLERRFKGSAITMRAKTGTLHAVSCLSGYFSVGEKEYCFSMMFNNFTCPRKRIESIQEEILAALVAHLHEEK